MSETTSSKMDMALDDIIKTTRKPRQGGGRGGRGGRGGQRRGGQGGRRGGFGGRSGGKGNPGLKTSGPSKLTIKNLDHGVTDSDIYELFSEFGSMKSAAIHYNRNGQSLGTAVVTFARGQDAMRAMKQYNGVHLDGRAMRVSMEQGAAGGMVKRLGQGGQKGGQRKGNQGRGGRGRGGRGRGGRGGGRGNKSDSKPKTAEELDAEMDAYLQKKPTTADDLDKEMDAYAKKKGEKTEES